MEKWKSWAFGIGAGWVLLAFVAWHYESTCGMFLSGACFSVYWDSLRKIVLLKWVYSYQTLLGGLAAVIGGAFVLFAASASTKSAERAANKAHLKSSLIACSIISDEFRELSIEMRKIRTQHSIPLIVSEHLPTLPSYLPQLHHISPMLGSMISAVRRDAESAAKDRSSHTYDWNVVIAKSYAISAALSEIEKNLSDDGTYDFGNGELFAGADLSNRTRVMGIPPKALIGWYALFDWEK